MTLVDENAASFLQGQDRLWEGLELLFYLTPGMRLVCSITSENIKAAPQGIDSYMIL